MSPLLLVLALAPPVLEDPAGAVDLRAAFCRDALEDTAGAFLPVNSLAAETEEAGARRFGAARLLMRPVGLRVDDGDDVYVLELEQGDATREVVSLFTPDGERVSLPRTWRGDALPRQLLVNGLHAGKAVLKLRRTEDRGPPSGPAGDRILLRVGPFPGLAGHSLPAHPWFEYPLAVNHNASLETALDPLRHSERAGLAYDVHVVRHRSPGEWSEDPTLADVTGTVEHAAVSGTTIPENVLVAWPAELDAVAGIQLGVPYDVVYDFGQDGRLDPGDLIDGLGQGEAGFWAVRDTTKPGPYGFRSFEFDDAALFHTEGFDGGSTRDMASHGLVVYPDPMPEGKLPLVTFSHGNTANRQSYQGYRYLQEHLASYGFVTASFDMFPAHVAEGIRWRGWLTNKNTERLILQTELEDHHGNPYPPMGNGVLDGRVDPDRIVTVGHSRGGEGVILQYNQVAHPEIEGIRPPNGTLRGFDADSFLGIVTIAQVTFLTQKEGSRTRDRNYLMFYGGADSDVCGCAASALPTVHYHRAKGDKMMTYLYGAGHGYFNQEWSCTCTGPVLMDRVEVEECTKGYLLPFVMLVTHGSPPARDFFTRSPDRFRPIGTEFLPVGHRVVNLYRDATDAGNFVIEDYEQNLDPFLSSSGQPVSFTVQDLFEEHLEDANPAGGWSPAEPDGAFWWETNGCLFNWNGNSFEYSLTLAPEERDLSDDAYLSFLVAQQPSHPDTTADHGPRNISVALVDARGVKASINTDSYGDIDKTLRRSQGWGAAFKTFRLRIADFEAGGSGIDLTDVIEVRIEVGADHGSVQGRLGFDDFEIVRR